MDDNQTFEEPVTPPKSKRIWYFVRIGFALALLAIVFKRVDMGGRASHSYCKPLDIHPVRVHVYRDPVHFFDANDFWAETFGSASRLRRIISIPNGYDILCAPVAW